jgi:hypothetical protein
MSGGARVKQGKKKNTRMKFFALGLKSSESLNWAHRLLRKKKLKTEKSVEVLLEFTTSA